MDANARRSRHQIDNNNSIGKYKLITMKNHVMTRMKKSRFPFPSFVLYYIYIYLDRRSSRFSDFMAFTGCEFISLSVHRSRSARRPSLRFISRRRVCGRLRLRARTQSSFPQTSTRMGRWKEGRVTWRREIKQNFSASKSSPFWPFHSENRVQTVFSSCSLRRLLSLRRIAPTICEPTTTHNVRRPWKIPP